MAGVVARRGLSGVHSAEVYMVVFQSFAQDAGVPLLASKITQASSFAQVAVKAWAASAGLQLAIGVSAQRPTLAQMG